MGSETLGLSDPMFCSLLYPPLETTRQAYPGSLRKDGFMIDCRATAHKRNTKNQVDSYLRALD
jgi:hypothetical protein